MSRGAGRETGAVMRASGNFTVTAFTPVDPVPGAGVTTASTVGVVSMEKRFTGEITGRSTTLFVHAMGPATDIGGYVAMESFEGRIQQRSGAFNFSHSATTTGDDRANDSFTIIPGSGMGELAGILGTGEITVDADGTHHIRFDYELPK